jgi:protein-tyrosine phosphatase
VSALPPTAPAAPGDAVSILFVCTGNVCRSVLAERITQARLRALGGDAAARFRVGSAGTEGVDGRPVHPLTAGTLSRLGACGRGFTSRRLTREHVEQASLILCAERAHLDQVIAVCPAASRRSFLLLEFARLAAFAAPVLAGPDLARRVIAAAARSRGRIPYRDPREDEIADPPVTAEAFLCCARDLDATVRDVVDLLSHAGHWPRIPTGGKS